MSQTADRVARLRGSAVDRAARRGLTVALVLMVAAVLVPALAGWNVRVNSFPPLHARWDPRWGVGTVPALALAVLLGHGFAGRARSLRWRTLLLVTFLAGLAWMLSLALVDGISGVGHILGTDYEYLQTARATDDLPATLREYVSRIRYDAAPDNWPVHIAGHPPGALVFFVALVRIGLGSGLAAGVVVVLLAATTAVATLVTVRTLGAEDLARRAAPYLVVGPAAIWQAVSADAMFAAVAAWGLAALAAASTRRSVTWALLAGLLLGYCVMLSYGLPLLGVLALAVMWLGGSWRPLVPAALAALGVVAVFHAFGFSYAEALPAIRDRYFEGVGGRRPAAYWLWGGPAALLFATGPLLGAGLGALAAQAHRRAVGAVAALSGAAVVSVLLATASQMSKAEVERIWLPFVPWLLLSCALLPDRWQRPALAAQAGFALLVQHLLFTGW
ncbi:hypothetical protein [Nocardioides iriomotensis]|uniref:Glycosyltransferase RgtA/B/C/D-like domain-containing protein n=1 Tax=Nocardioides iriomotensis TaxID=715784 RepID=A0A4Q5J6P5_9ACTN|nr:hypothetical protein [Nocardioides iriomotensis]RYU14332.1 hypothetical protein ETU37_03750 [Nocardioides iriomotensis]